MRFPLALLLLGVVAAGGQVAPLPDAPQSLPLIYDQPGGTKYILRIDSRRYEVPNVTKEAVVRLMADANYPRTKLRFDEFKRSLEDKTKAEAVIRRAQQNLDRETERVARLRRGLESLRTQLALLRGQTNVDFREILLLQEQIRNTTVALATAEDQEAKTRLALDRTQADAAATLRRADQAREEYADALARYEKPLAEIRAIAMASGTAY